MVAARREFGENGIYRYLLEINHQLELFLRGDFSLKGKSAGFRPTG